MSRAVLSAALLIVTIPAASQAQFFQRLANRLSGGGQSGGWSGGGVFQSAPHPHTCPGCGQVNYHRTGESSLCPNCGSDFHTNTPAPGSPNAVARGVYAGVRPVGVWPAQGVQVAQPQQRWWPGIPVFPFKSPEQAYWDGRTPLTAAQPVQSGSPAWPGWNQSAPRPPDGGLETWQGVAQSVIVDSGLYAGRYTIRAEGATHPGRLFFVGRDAKVTIDGRPAGLGEVAEWVRSQSVPRMTVVSDPWKYMAVVEVRFVTTNEPIPLPGGQTARPAAAPNTAATPRAAYASLGGA